MGPTKVDFYQLFIHKFLESIDVMQEIDDQICIPLNSGVGVQRYLSQSALNKIILQSQCRLAQDFAYSLYLVFQIFPI